MNMRELLERRAATVAAMRQLADHPAGEGGDLSDEQAAAFDRHKGELEAVEQRIGRQQLVDDAERRMAAPAIVRGNGRDGTYEARARQFSIVKAINAQLGEQVDNGLEREISTELRSRSGRTFVGIPVPDEVFLTERRTILVSPGMSPPNAAADLYPTQHDAARFIDRLRASLLVGRLGATVLDGLVGDVEIPRQLTSSTAQHVGEDGALSRTDPTFDDISLSPKTVGAVTSYSRRTIINAQPSIEALVRNDLAQVVAAAIDFQALFGDGMADTPRGVVDTPSVGSSSLATPSWAEVLAMIAGIQAQDADLESLGWAMGVYAVSKLRGTNRVSGEPEHGFLMMDPGSLAGYPVAVATVMPGDPTMSPAVAATVIFGAWSQLLVGYWSGLDMLVNPYSEADYLRGRVSLRVMRDYDVAVRHVESFTVASDLPVT